MKLITHGSVVLMNGFAIIFLGLVSFGLLYEKVNSSFIIIYMFSLNPSEIQLYALAMVSLIYVLSWQIYLPYQGL